MPATLDQIMSRTLLSMLTRKAAADIPTLERLAAAHQPRGFAAALRTTAVQGVAVIAEMKKASPSRGVLRDEYHPAELAQGYEKVGAAAISVLTDEEFFQGALADLTTASGAVTIPILRKDFILDPFQILEARAAGADAILLIVAAHPDDVLEELAESARTLALDVLCEVHDREELERALALGFRTIGVNSRNLRTMQVDLATHTALAPHLPHSTLRVAESGIRTRADIDRLLESGYDAFLIGEAFMRQPDPAGALALLLEPDVTDEVGVPLA